MLDPFVLRDFLLHEIFPKKLKKIPTKTIFPKAKPYFITNFGFIFKPAAITYTSRKKMEPTKVI